MERESARQEIRRQWRQLLATDLEPAKRPANGEQSFVCPICGHGKNGDGLTYNPHSADKNGLKCFGCGFSGDVIDLYMQRYNVDYNTALQELADRLNIEIDGQERAERPQRHSNTRQGEFTPATTEAPQEATESAEEPLEDNSLYFRECWQRLRNCADKVPGTEAAQPAIDYLKARGISIETALECLVGFDPASDPARKGYKTPRLIFPNSNDSSYTARRIDGETRLKFMNGGGRIAMFNTAAYLKPEVFIVESAIDALSIIEAGGQAIALNSCSNTGLFVDAIDRWNATEPPAVILSLDNDDPGQKASEQLEKALKKKGIAVIKCNVAGEYKDANEALCEDKATFERRVAAAVNQARKLKRPDSTEYYVKYLMKGDLAKCNGAIPTGFSNLDRVSGGGLYPGLYIVAAATSLGKTTFLLQIADQVAAGGNDVIFFSLEMSRLELVTKSIARTAAEFDPTTKVTALGIRKGDKSQEVSRATAEYLRKTGGKLSIAESNFGSTVKSLEEYLQNYIKRNRTRPIVIIDYLQALQPIDRRQATKDAMDDTITALKRLSRDLNLTIIGVSSMNRANYLLPVDFESLKETGALEYTADVVWGMQLTVMNDNNVFSKDKDVKRKRDTLEDAKKETPRKIELKCIKNRFGITSYKTYFRYYPGNDLFEAVRAKADL